MGLAGLFPGISAGTVALLLGIHGRLIRAMANVDRFLPRDLWRAVRGDRVAKTAVRRVDLGFVFLIVAGMLTTTFSAAKGVTWLQEVHPGPLMALFLGLIVAGAQIPWRRIQSPGWREGLFLVPGALLAVALAFAPEGTLGEGAWRFVLGGLVAMPMMILPGVSGSAMLVTLGIYSDAVAAAADFDVLLLLLFLAGGLVGLLGSAKGLRWLLEHHHGPTMAFLTGLLAGSVVRVWPWRSEAGFAVGVPASPDHDLWWLAWTLAAAVLVTVLERRFAPRPDRDEEAEQGRSVQGSDE